MERMYSVIPVTYYRVTANGKTSYYSKYEELDQGFARVMKNGKWGILTPQGNVWGRMEFSKIHDKFCDGLIRVEKEGKFGYADRETGRFIECVFDKAADFNNGIAKVKFGGSERIINSIGKFVD